MPDAGELLRLAELVPDWDGWPLRLETEIGLALDLFPQFQALGEGLRTELLEVKSNHANVAVVNQNGGRVIHSVQPLPYLSSVDAGLTVAPPNHITHLSEWDHDILRAKGPWMAMVMPRETMGMGTRYGFTNRCQNAPTAARALLCAALRAQAYQLIPPPEPEETKQ